MSTATLKRTDTERTEAAQQDERLPIENRTGDAVERTQPQALPTHPQSASRVKTLARRAFYGAWRRLPEQLQALAFRLGAPKVSLGAVAIIQDARGRVLMAHHTYRQRQPWGLPGGLIGHDEQPTEALARELREEMGVAALIGPLIYAETCLTNSHLTLYYRATILAQPQPDQVEIDGYCYIPLDEAPTYLGPETGRCLACLAERRAS